MSSTLLHTLNSLDREMRKERKNARKSKSKKEEESIEGLKFEDIAESVPTEQYKRDK
jgi:hypothetical protein|nr:MAG TPA: hypothetical protein [Crassvirales sp.]DAJ75083.1 MAG TPA: hypothetical protein [Caudoviricetes sp.]